MGLSFPSGVLAQRVIPPTRLDPAGWLADAPVWALDVVGDKHVRLHVAVNEIGLVTSCSITLSSGIAKLDEAACFLVSINARYNPARTGAGTPVVAGDDVAFLIKAHPPIKIGYPVEAFRRSEQGSVTALLSVGTDGRPTACKIAKSSHSESLDTASCIVLTRTFRAIPPKDIFGKYIPFESEKIMNWKLPD